MAGENDKPRWQYRFDSFGRALALLRDSIEQLEERGLSDLEREGAVQRFEYTWELAWKLLADYLWEQGITLSAVTPRSAFRAAIEAGVIGRGEDWMESLDDRSKMSHTYNFSAFEKVVEKVRSRYLSLFEDLHDRLVAEAMQRL